MDIRYGRKRRGIKKQLEAKIDDWLLTIDDEAVKAAILKDVIVTGGSIASMLLREKINDYNVYFRTKATTKMVAEYYVRKFNERVKNSSVNDYEPEVREETITNIKGAEEERIVIFIKSAGIASEEQEHYSYFETMGEDAAIDFAESVVTDVKENDKERYRPVFMSQNAISLSNKLQIVVRFYGGPSKIHDNYDFIHATCYWDQAKQDLHLPAEAMEALLSRTLIYKGSLYPIASVFRTKKFLERGWRITAGQQLKMMRQISELDLTDYNTLREQLTGVDTAYMWELIQALKGVKPEKINSSYIGAIVDKIFG